jgi:hypothetical protein
LLLNEATLLFGQTAPPSTAFAVWSYFFGDNEGDGKLLIILALFYWSYFLKLAGMSG